MNKTPTFIDSHLKCQNLDPNIETLQIKRPRLLQNHQFGHQKLKTFVIPELTITRRRLPLCSQLWNHRRCLCSGYLLSRRRLLHPPNPFSFDLLHREDGAQLRLSDQPWPPRRSREDEQGKGSRLPLFLDWDPGLRHAGTPRTQADRVVARLDLRCRPGRVLGPENCIFKERGLK